MHATSPLSLAPTHGYERRPLFKSDYPRTIDRYIDYFEGAPAIGNDDDACGDTLLDRLA